MKKRFFPSEFLWGCSLSAYQAEGQSSTSDWQTWERKGKVLEQCGHGVGFSETFREDIATLGELHQNAFRFSLDWSRVEPAETVLDPKVLAHYRDILKELKANGIKVFLTLHHFTNPQWFHALGGWERRRNVKYFLNYVQTVVDELKELVDFWQTFNEPYIFATSGYYDGSFPPGQRSWKAFRAVQKNLIYAHKKSYEIIHQLCPSPQVGIAACNQYFEPADIRSPWDRLAVWLTDRFWNHSFLRRIKHHQDFIGVNYYFRNKLKFSLLFDWLAPNHFFSRSKNDNAWVGDNGSEIFPEGLYHVLKGLKRYKVPLYVTENGIADQADIHRQKFIFQHLKFVYVALRDLCDVRGYFYWSLLDNYEWGSFAPRFGLVSADHEMFARTVRPSAWYYADICKKNYIEF